jgi:glycosyltransferase involved in cell wall biosynthesis
MKKFSIVIPVYNEQEAIRSCLKSIKRLDYPNNNYEVIIINDASSDDSLKVCKELANDNFKIINNQKNIGRFKSRKKGVVESKNPHVIFIDARVRIESNSLKVLNEINEKVVSSYNPQKNTNHYIQRTYFLLRRKIYGKNFLQKKAQSKITKENFDSIPTGSIIKFEKKILLESMNAISNTTKNCSDDTKLLKKILEKTPYIIRAKKFEISYESRSSIIAVIKHSYERGPKFTDYYYKKGKKKFHLINLALFLVAATITITLKYALYAELILLVLLSNLLFSIYISKNLKDIIKSFIVLPAIVIPFFAGIIKGIFLKLNNN